MKKTNAQLKSEIQALENEVESLRLESSAGTVIKDVHIDMAREDSTAIAIADAVKEAMKALQSINSSGSVGIHIQGK